VDRTVLSTCSSDTTLLYPHKQSFLLHSFQFPPTTGHSGAVHISHILYISLKFLSVGPKQAIHHHPHFLSCTISQFLLPWTNSYTLYPLDSSDWSNFLYPLPPPYQFGIHTCKYRILPTLKRPAYSSKTSLSISTSATCHRTQKTIICTIPAMNTLKTNSVVTCGH
jgi:hypothetical protein